VSRLFCDRAAISWGMKIPSPDANPFTIFADVLRTAQDRKWPAKKMAAALISTAENTPRAVASTTQKCPARRVRR
jgi:hypothetical protein